MHVANGGTSSYSLVFKDTWGNALSIYENNYVLVTAVIIHWGCMVTDDALNILSPNETNSSIIIPDNVGLLYTHVIFSKNPKL